MSRDDEAWQFLTERNDQRADRWYKPAGIGLLVGIIGGAIAISNHPTPTWAVVASVIGWIVCVVSFAIPMSAAYGEGNRLEAHINSLPDDDGDVEDYPYEDFDDEDEFEYVEPTVQPTPTPAPSAPPAGGNLLSSLRQQSQ